MAAATLPEHALIQRAGIGLAHFVLAVYPHADVIWIVCGPGNNGGDGLEAAIHLKSWGKQPVVTCTSTNANLPKDARHAYQKAVDAKVAFSAQGPDRYDVCVDAIFGCGPIRPFDATYSRLISHINSQTAPVIAVDIPTGIDADTGSAHSSFICADFTLSLLTLKPGLFTADGRDGCGEIWFNNLEVSDPTNFCAVLNPTPIRAPRLHATHKGTYGDVAIVGGASGMTGAAHLAATAALQGGAGRVFVVPLEAACPRFHESRPELMFRDFSDVQLKSMTVVAGCGGGSAVAKHMRTLLEQAERLVLDADALNAIAELPELQTKLRQRMIRTTVLTPHPLEAARLLGLQTAEIQNDRLKAARTLAEKFQSIVVLKGSGTIVAAPGETPRVNITGNALLATAGSGDVLAGLIGAKLARNNEAFTQTCQAVFEHGEISNTWPPSSALTALGLAKKLS
jgi:hydroxyethylthiazole kinase-like uncharacterized protein yjeF